MRRKISRQDEILDKVARVLEGTQVTAMDLLKAKLEATYLAPVATPVELGIALRRLGYHNRLVPAPRKTIHLWVLSECQGWTGRQLREALTDDLERQLGWRPRYYMEGYCG